MYHEYSSSLQQRVRDKIRITVTRIFLRMRDWPACVATAKNNVICVFKIKRDKRTRDAGRCAGRYLAAEHPDALACLQLQCPFLSRMGRTHHIVLTILNTVTQPVEN
jgi:hypothetical protein